MQTILWSTERQSLFRRLRMLSSRVRPHFAVTVGGLPYMTSWGDFLTPSSLVTVANQLILSLLSTFWDPLPPPTADVINGSPLVASAVAAAPQARNPSKSGPSNLASDQKLLPAAEPVFGRRGRPRTFLPFPLLLSPPPLPLPSSDLANTKKYLVPQQN